MTDIAHSHSELMDRIYSWQTGIYDLTRRYFLFGRNQLLDKMIVSPGDRILEVGCGTGRNLRVLANKYPQHHFYGLDCSQVMLDCAAEKARGAGCGERLHFANAYGEAFDHQQTFGLEQPFTTIFFSYSITMIPTWQETVENALRNLTPDGTLWFVDFYDQKGMLPPLRAALVKWLALFHVAHKPELEPFLRDLAAKNGDEFTVSSHLQGYYFIATYRRTAKK